MRRYSYSKISTYLRCPRLYRLRYEDRLEPERLSLALPLGSAMHDALQWEVAERGRGREPGAGEIHEVFRELLLARLEIAGCPVAGDPEEASETGRRMIEAYIAWGRLQEISTIEGEHLGPITEDIELEGRIDFVRDQGRAVEILELKTSARAWSQAQADMNLQAACYALLTGIERVRFVVLTKTKEPKIQEIPTVCPPERLDLLVMPCWQQVKIEAAIRLKDRGLLQEVLGGLGAVLEGQVIRKDGLRFQIGEDGSVSAEVTAAQAEAAESFLKALKREYALATLTQWAKSQRFAVKRQGMKLKTRRWIG